ncbi:transcriptional regulator, ArsR family [Lentzea xinjiangensis]|uniref:Transcriptional regulator, ArsR family n=1 Tax=Lentzea xinjiangensis TaxID=402600 RepID=A0A1H9KKC1_9PSEU|nr:metalloregulator ArsR/SmtB family transcription factor [Lentzea xinjiangensis]SEQ99590.1 transcriptional regulator, ArsR family [Lentzea xinjiangensis]
MSLDADVLKVLADPLRARILELLAGEALCTCHLVEETGAKQTNVSNHLKVLREAGFVDTEPCGRFTYYRLRSDALRRVAGSLTELADRAGSDARRPC